jgi:hypothetical protein
MMKTVLALVTLLSVQSGQNAACTGNSRCDTSKAYTSNIAGYKNAFCNFFAQFHGLR